MILELQHRRPDGDVDTYHLKPGRRYHLGRGSACEVRILDLKLSRKHAALEFQEGEWKLIDLCSTNGCQLNGTVMVGTSPLREGHLIEIGQTALTIGPISAKTGPSSSSSGPQAPPAITPVPALEHSPTVGTSYISDEFRAPVAGNHADLDALSPIRVDQSAPTQAAPRPASNAVPVTPVAPEPVRKAVEPRRGAVAPVVIASMSSTDDLDLEDTVATVPPSSLPAPASISPEPVRRPPPPPFVAPPPKDVASQTPALGSPAPTPAPAPTLAPAPAPAPAAPNGAANSDDRSYFITVLGRRVGPLSRAVARDLKSRELKGILKPSELDLYPRA